jgi:DNA-binding response OmpR family regulator
MSRRLLIIEPDAAGRAMMDRVLTADGFSADTAASALETRALLDAGVFEVVVVDELAGSRPALEEVRWLRHKYPTVPIIVTGALLSRRVMQELLRLRVADALSKPFTPAELRESVARAIEQKTAHHEEALEYDVALTDARRAIAAGLGTRARAPLARAQAMSSFDSEIMALQALLAEIEGKDADADHGYRAALALRDEEACPPPDPHEGLARLGAYGGARPVAALSAERATQPFWIVSDPVAELRATSLRGAPTDPREPHVVVMGLGLPTDGPGMVFLREGQGPRAFALLAGSMRAESVATALATLGAGAVVASQTTAASLDLARVDELRAKPPPSPRAPASNRERTEVGGSRDELAKRDQVAR